MMEMPAVSLVAVPGRRRATLDLAREIERAGFSAIFSPSFNDGLGWCEALALQTREIPLGTGIANIYARHPIDYAQTAALVQELSGGRFWFGIGVSHGPTHGRLGIRPGPPLRDVRRFAEQYRSAEPQAGSLPPLVLAALRVRMVELAAAIGNGVIFAMAARSHMPASLAHLQPEQRMGSSFLVANILNVCIDEDRAAAAAVVRRALRGYVALPNYRNYWTEAGYGEQMDALAAAVAAGDEDRITTLMDERWLEDVALFGDAATVRAGVEAWQASGVRTVVLAPVSTRGGQMQAFAELLDGFRRKAV